RELDVPDDDEWAPFPPESPEGRHVRRLMADGIGLPRRYRPPPLTPVPERLELPPRPTTSTQEAFGDVLAAPGPPPGPGAAPVTLGRGPGRPGPPAGSGRRAGHRVRRRRDDDPSVRLGQPARGVRDPRAGRRLRAPRAPAARPLEGSSGGPAPGAGDRGSVVLHPPLGPRPGAGALRPAAPADRHPVRLLPAARARSLAPRAALQGPLPPPG